MIAFVSGIVEEIQIDSVVIDVGGIGYLVHISPSTADRLPGIGQPVKIFTYTSVKEDDISLFGFLSRDELSLFKLLITVNGIGPKGGLSILSVLSADDLRFAILSSDSKTLSKAPGIGKKTAERLVLELHDKISNEDILNGNAGGSMATGSAGEDLGDTGSRDEAVEALAALGYNKTDAMRAVRKVTAEAGTSLDTEQILKLALKEMF